MTVKILNSGNQSITTADFDDNDPLSIVIGNGNVIKANILDTSDSYFKKIFLHSNQIEDRIELPKFILEPDQYFIFKILVLHNASRQPTITTKGRIAKIGSVTIIRSPEVHKFGLIPSSFNGDITVQAIRVGGYGIGTITVLLAVAFIFVFTRNTYDTRKRIKKEKEMEAKVNSFLDTVEPDTSRKLKPFVPLIVIDSSLGSYSYRKDIVSRLFDLIQEFDDVATKKHRELLLQSIDETLSKLIIYGLIPAGARKEFDDTFIKEFKRLLKFIRG